MLRSINILYEKHLFAKSSCLVLGRNGKNYFRYTIRNSRLVSSSSSSSNELKKNGNKAETSSKEKTSSLIRSSSLSSSSSSSFYKNSLFNPNHPIFQKPILESLSPTTTLAVLCGHSAFVFTGLAYMTTDVLHLRSLAMCGMVSSMLFQFYRPKPLLLPLKWNALFLTINLVMATWIWRERTEADHMDQRLVQVYEEGLFESRGFSKVEFYRLFRLAKECTRERGDGLKEMGHPINRLYFIENGKASITRNGSFLSNVTANDFVAEKEFLQSMNNRLAIQNNNHRTNGSNDFDLSSAKIEDGITKDDTLINENAIIDTNSKDITEGSILSTENVTVDSESMTLWYWDFEELKEYLSTHKDVSNALLAFISHELVEKLTDSWTRIEKDEKQREELQQLAVTYLLDGGLTSNIGQDSGKQL